MLVQEVAAKLCLALIVTTTHLPLFLNRNHLVSDEEKVEGAQGEALRHRRHLLLQQQKRKKRKFRQLRFQIPNLQCSCHSDLQCCSHNSAAALVSCRQLPPTVLDFPLQNPNPCHCRPRRRARSTVPHLSCQLDRFRCSPTAATQFNCHCTFFSLLQKAHCNLSTEKLGQLSRLHHSIRLPLDFPKAVSTAALSSTQRLLTPKKLTSIRSARPP